MRIRTLLKFGLIYFIIIFALNKGVDFIKRDFFYITNIEFKGNYQLTENSIVKELLKIKNENIWFVESKRLQDFIRNDIRIKKFKIKKKIPYKLIVEIEERDPYVYVLFNDRVFIADEDKVIFSYRNENVNKNLIVLRINSEKELDVLYKVMKNLEKSKMKNLVSEMFVEENVVKFLLKDGLLVKTSKDVNEEKYNISKRLYNKLKEKDEELIYIDLRFKDFIVR